MSFNSCQNGFVALSNNQLGDGDPNPFLQDPVEDSAPVMMVGCSHCLFTIQSQINSYLYFQDGKDIYAGMQTLSIKKDKEEPEFMRKWKEEQQERLRKKDEEESAAMEELKVKAKQELEDWYKRYETQVDKTKSSNREEETKYDNIEMNGIEPGTEWERVSKHCDFSSKVPCYWFLKICQSWYILYDRPQVTPKTSPGWGQLCFNLSKIKQWRLKLSYQ